MQTCPACKHPSIKAWKKALVGGLLTITCPCCHASLGMPAYDMVPLLLILAWYSLFNPPLVYFGVGFVVYMIIRQIYIPLVVRAPPLPTDPL